MRVSPRDGPMPKKPLGPFPLLEALWLTALARTEI
jgi:hypothetical protein